MLLSYVDNEYLVLHTTKSLQLTFSDQEDNAVVVRLVSSTGINAFVLKANATSFNLMLQPAGDSTFRSSIVLEYTDVYHKAPNYWTQVSIGVDVFSTEPPRFVSSLASITFDRCLQSFASYALPDIVDPDSTSFNVSVDDKDVSWVQIVSTAPDQLYSQQFYVVIDNNANRLPSTALKYNLTL
uniref:Uncharacterized protein n=1 Tax=Euplotes harpa TaxID=151035 RepID=A0A7S3JHM2_9SPIT|mmetsp:Transcript_37771/g.43415  ORF Transcript_37771/g.43415 Transcript_37771/m.43415 type:complete len:183 (+) Transcript_37771:416-964(+)